MILYSYRNSERAGIMECRIDLRQLFATRAEREGFESRWPDFLKSDDANRRLFALKKNHLLYQTEQLVPTKKDKRPPLLLVFGNPASHSVKAGMFFAFDDDGRENRFWRSLLKPAGVMDISSENRLPASEKNRMRSRKILALDYDSPFRIGFCVFMSMPSSAGGPWAGVAGIRKLIGSRAMKRLEAFERERVMACAKRFLGHKGIAVAFQKDAWNNLRSEKDPLYSLNAAKNGTLRGSLRERPTVLLFGVPPTRLLGPSRRVLRKVVSWQSKVV
jgi:hypothetical protein